MNKSRPVNLNLFTIRFPNHAIVSILHRVSGVLIFLCIPALLWLLQVSLRAPEDFMMLQAYLALPIVKLLIWIFLSGLAYHLVAGIRHLIMDMGIGESLAGGRLGANLVLTIATVLIISIGVWLWV